MPWERRTDMTSPVEAPPVKNILDSSSYFEYSRRGTKPGHCHGKTCLAIPHSFYCLSFPNKKYWKDPTVLSWILIAGAIITVIGITVAWIISRNITKAA